MRRCAPVHLARRSEGRRLHDGTGPAAECGVAAACHAAGDHRSRAGGHRGSWQSPDQVRRAVDPRHGGARAPAPAEPLGPRPDGLRRRRRSSAPASSCSPARWPRPTAGPAVVHRRSSSPASPAGWRPSATPSSPPPCRSPGRRTRSPTRRLGELSPGSSAGTWCSSSRSARPRSSVGWSGYLGNLFGQLGIAAARPRSPASRRNLDSRRVLIVAGDDRHADPRHQAVRAGQPGHRGIKVAIVLLVIIVGIFYINAANYSPFIPPAAAPGAGTPGCAPAAAADARRPRAGVVRRRRHLHRRRARVLRLHRLRHRRHGRGGDQEPAARPAARHPRLAGHLHGALRRGLPGRDRHGAVHQIEPSTAAPLADAFRHASGMPWLRRRDLGRRAGRPDHGGA